MSLIIKLKLRDVNDFLELSIAVNYVGVGEREENFIEWLNKNQQTTC